MSAEPDACQRPLMAGTTRSRPRQEADRRLIEGAQPRSGFGDLIEERYDIRYHNNYVPRLLHSLGFSVQRPRKRLARADAQAQAQWLKQRLPEIKKKPRNAEDE